MRTTAEPGLGERLEDSDLLRSTAFIDGRWTDAAAHSSFAVIDPASGATIAELPRFGAEGTRLAVEAARTALPEWRHLPPVERSTILRRWADLVREHASDLATLVTAENGKPIREAQGEVTYGARFFDWFAEEGRRAYGDVIPSDAVDNRIVVLKEPVGVVAGITPWNLPAAMVMRKVAPALAAGCTMVLKPAEQTPLTALAICELGIRAGLPRGVLNVVTGNGKDASAIGVTLTEHPDVRKIGFTGSTEVGKLLMRQCSETVTRVSLELGGNSPFLVFEDADVDLAVDGMLAAKYRNAGQLCTAANRVLVHNSVADDFLSKLTDRVAQLQVGSGFEAGTDMGPLIDEQGLTKVADHVEDMVQTGGRVVVGGNRHSRGGTYFEPTIVEGITRDAKAWSEETFGPVAAVATFADEQEAVRLANDTRYGLVAYVFTRDLARSWRVSEAIEAGMVALNTGRASNEMAPFGGIKESGIGREGSRYGLDEWLELKYLNLGGLDPR